MADAAPMVILMAIVLVIGLYLPAPLVDMLNDAVRFSGGTTMSSHHDSFAQLPTAGASA